MGKRNRGSVVKRQRENAQRQRVAERAEKMAQKRQRRQERKDLESQVPVADKPEDLTPSSSPPVTPAEAVQDSPVSHQENARRP